MIPLSVPHLSGNEWRYLKECLDSNWVSSVGPFVTRFEQDLASVVGSPHAVATVTGTAALHTALLAAGVEPDDEVLVSTLTFIASVNAIRYCGAWPVLMDAEPDYWQMDGQKMSEFLGRECRWVNGALRNRSTGRRVKAVLPVHLLGHPVDADPILDAANQFELVVVEDASESLGARYKERSVGTLGKIACFSFNGNKIITTGGGGMVTTADPALAGRARYLTTQARDDADEDVHGAIGYNYRLTNVQAALGVAQLERLAAHVERKRQVAMRYEEALRDLPGITCPSEAPWARSIYWLYTVMIEPASFGRDRRSVQQHLAEQGIETRPIFRPAHRQLPHRDAQAYRIDVADRLYAEALSLPCSVGLTDEQQDRVINALRSLAGRRG